MIVDRADTRAHLAQLMNEEAGTLQELETLLTREHQILARNEHVEALEDACAARQICMGTLLRIQEERRALLRMLGLTVDNAGIEALLQQCDPVDSLREKWRTCADSARRCRELNDRNGALVHSRMRRVEGMLEIITGSRPGTPVYGRQGQLDTSPAGYMVAAEA